jgi:hypothetical protein
VLEDAINEIHNQNASGLSFEELYRYVHAMQYRQWQTLLAMSGARLLQARVPQGFCWRHASMHTAPYGYPQLATLFH